MIRKISKEMQREIGKALVLESAPGYSEQAQGKHYAVDTHNAGAFDAVMVLQETAAWKPWPDGAYAISVWDFVEDGYDFDPTPEDENYVDDDSPEAYDYEQDAYEEAVMFAESQIPNEWEDES